MVLKEHKGLLLDWGGDGPFEWIVQGTNGLRVL